MSASSFSINSLHPSPSSSAMSIPRDISIAIAQLDQLAPGKEKSPAEIEEGAEKVCKEALKILASVPDQANQREIFAALKNSLTHFELSHELKKRLYSALAKSPLSDAQTSQLDKRDINYEEFSDIYTLEFQDGEMKISKAELSTLGDYFTALFASGMLEAASKTIALKDLETEQFDDLRKYMSGTCPYDLDDPDTRKTLKTLVGRFNLLPVYPNSITPEQWANPAAFLETLPLMPQALVDFLDGPCPIYPGKTVRETHIVVPLIKNITVLENGVSVTKPRTLKSLDKLDKDSGGVGFHSFWDGIFKPKVDKPADVAFEWAVMTKDVLPGSREKAGYHLQQLAVEKGYQVPGLLDAATCILWASRYLGARLYSDNPETYTTCQEFFSEFDSGTYSDRMVIGDFDPNGLRINTDDWEGGGPAFVGVAGLRKFPAR